MASEHNRIVHARVVRTVDAAHPAIDQAKLLEDDWRRTCGCIRTSDKLKEILKTFPAPPPPSPIYDTSCISARCLNCHEPRPMQPYQPLTQPCKDEQLVETTKMSNRSMQVIYELAQLVQLSVTATALALYYLIYCYMQLVYYTLRSALYFHNADGPMKVTIGVVTVTSLVVGFNLLIRMEKLIGIF